jgi:AbiV family abortive infection protein
LTPQLPALDLRQIVVGMIACRLNARELLEEADYLSSTNYSARSYALVHTACEELAKFSILELAGKRIVRGDPPSWKRFWLRFRSHNAKIAQLNVQLLSLVLESGAAEDIEIVNAAEILFDRGLLIRNSAFYVDVGPDGMLRKPSDLDFSVPLPSLRGAAKLALDAADKRGSSPEDFERWLSKPKTKTAEWVADALLVTSFQRLKDAGLKVDDVKHIIDNYLKK